MTRYFLIWIAALSVIALLLYAIDKRKAKKKRWRIPEKTLLLLGFLGGAAGALLGMILVRHKTKHFKFMFGIPAIIEVQAAAVFALFYFGVLQIV